MNAGIRGPRLTHLRRVPIVAPAQVIYGDEFLVSTALRELQEEVGPVESREANCHRVSAPQANLSSISPMCNAMPFLAEKRLVMVTGALAEVEPSRAGGQRRGRSRASARSSARVSEGSWEGLEGYLECMPPTTLLVFVDGPIRGGNPLLERLHAVAQVRELPTPNGEALSRWIRSRVGEKGCSIVPGAITLLSQLVGPNLRVLDNELEKLALYAGEESIVEAHVRELVPEMRETSVFNVVDAVLERRPAVALRATNRLSQGGAGFSEVIAMVSMQVRRVVLARHLLDSGLPQSEIGSRLNIGPDFVLRKTMQQARSHSPDGLAMLYEALLEADLAVKQGRMEEEVALQLLVTQVPGR